MLQAAYGKRALFRPEVDLRRMECFFHAERFTEERLERSQSRDLPRRDARRTQCEQRRKRVPEIGQRQRRGVLGNRVMLHDPRSMVAMNDDDGIVPHARSLHRLEQTIYKALGAAHL